MVMVWLSGSYPIARMFLARRVELHDLEMVFLALHHILDHFEVDLLAVALVAVADHLHAWVLLPLTAHLLDELPAVRELHPVPHAVEQVLVAALVDADHGDGGAVASLAGAFARIHQHIDVEHGGYHVVALQPDGLEGG